ncbi:MAG TPA: c-type cytochrome [Acidimicrobiia bacterium]|nr:c-type cytochrome [Acidimicrobiia bacterium]
MSVRQALIILNGAAILAIVVVIAVRVLSLRRNPEPSPPPNKTPFLDDEDLEGRRLERVLGWSLFFVLITAVALPVYFLVEPDRQVAADRVLFEERSVERGAELYADEQSPDYDSTVSLGCARCHGPDAKGGSATQTIQPEDPSCDPEAAITEETPEQCRPVQVAWQAPALDVVLLLYSRAQVTEIITYGRAGTPMPPWGVKSGEGSKNEQSIDDLVNYLESIQISPEEARKASTKELEEAREQATADAEDAQQAVTEAQAEVAAAPPDALAGAQEDLAEAEESLAAAISWRDQLAAMSDGQLAFQQQCARCHTKGWSYFDPLDPEAAPPPGPMGGGAFGPNLTDGAELRQFPGATGVTDQILFVAQGVAPNKAYGVRGISSGRMPHFNETLSEDQIELIVEYERSL